MDKLMKVIAILGFFLFFAAIVIAGLAITALLIMFFGNIVLEYFDKKTLTFGVSYAMAVILWVIGGAFSRTIKSD